MSEKHLRARAPLAARRPSISRHHGIERVDDYAWLRADNWQAVMRDPTVLAPDIRAHLEAENAYAKAVMSDTEALQATLFAEMKGRIKEDDSTVPAPDGTFAYYTRYVTGGQHPVFCRTPRGGGAEQILVDGNALAAGQAYFRLANVAHSPDHSLVAYAVDTKGSEFYTVNIIEAATGKLVDARIADNNGSLEWAADSRTLLYVWLDQEHRPRRLLMHGVGGETADPMIYEQEDPGFFLGIGTTQDQRYLLLSVHDHETAEISLIDAHEPASPPRLVAARKPEHDYSVDHHEGRLIILTNSGGAEDYRIDRDAGRQSRPGELARDRAAPAGAADPRRRRLQGFPRAGSSARTDCRASSCAHSQTAKSTRSPSMRRPTRSASRTAMSTTRTRCASHTRP